MTPSGIAWGESHSGQSFFLHGNEFKEIEESGAAVAVALIDTGSYFRAEVSIANGLSQPFDVVPEKFHLQETSPKTKDLHFLSDEQMVKAANRRLMWASMLAGAAAGMAQQQTTTQSTTTGNVNAYSSNGTSANGTFNATTTSTSYSPDYAAQQRTNYQIAGARARLDVANSELENTVLRDTTVFSGQSVAGRVYFKRDRRAKSVLLVIPVNGTMMEFPFTLK
jgi:hypothetical protein